MFSIQLFMFIQLFKRIEWTSKVSLTIETFFFFMFNICSNVSFVGCDFGDKFQNFKVKMVLYVAIDVPSIVTSIYNTDNHQLKIECLHQIWMHLDVTMSNRKDRSPYPLLLLLLILLSSLLQLRNRQIHQLVNV